MWWSEQPVAVSSPDASWPTPSPVPSPADAAQGLAFTDWGAPAATTGPSIPSVSASQTAPGQGDTGNPNDDEEWV
jgi:hypothetical protein